MGAFITNFQSPIEIDDLEERFYLDGMTNLDKILSCRFNEDDGCWTVPYDAQVDDVVLYMCAKTSKDHMGHICAEIKRNGPKELLGYAEKQRAKYKEYAGKILAIGTVSGMPYQTESGYKHQYWKSRWYAEIKAVNLLDYPVDISEFRGYIKISRTGAITKLSSNQWSQLKQQILNKNPNLGSKEAIMDYEIHY